MMGGDSGVVGGAVSPVMRLSGGDWGGGVVGSMGSQGTKLSSSDISPSSDSRIENRFSSVMKVSMVDERGAAADVRVSQGTQWASGAISERGWDYFVAIVPMTDGTGGRAHLAPN
jgi:hypothetical protein